MYRRAGIAAIAELGLTAAHHVYGALLYDTPWRFHVAIVAPLVAIAIARTLDLGARRGGPSAVTWTRVAAALILLVPVGLIGFVEGGYNHILKDLFYFTGGEPLARALFSAPVYEMPDNFLFEASGIAQFPLGLAAAYFTLAIRPFRSRSA